MPSVYTSGFRRKSMPSAVKASIALNVVSVFVSSVPNFVLLVAKPAATITAATVVVGQFLFEAAFTAIFMVLIARRLNWARITLTCVVAFGGLLELVVILATAAELSGLALTRLLDLVLSVIAVVLLFRPAANAWFAARAPSGGVPGRRAPAPLPAGVNSQPGRP